MIMYELITLQVPFHSYNPMRISMMVMQGSQPDLPTGMDESYTKLAALHTQCIAFKPEDRPLPSKIKSVVALAAANL